jgi:heme exporter protein D
MWNGEKSISLSKFCVLFLVGVLIVTVVSAPWLTPWFLNFLRTEQLGTESFFLVTIYVGAVPAAYLLYNLLRLLRRIEAEQVFTTENVENLRRISWTCFVGAGVALVSVFYYFPWVFLAVAAAFMGLIVRVVKNVVAQAVALQDEVDSTI